MNNINEEIVKTLTTKLAYEEAARCLLCKDAPCSSACPAFTDPARFIRAVRFQNLEGAAEVVRNNNALGAICARVCPTEKYCQKACSRCGIDKPIDIGGIQRFITDYEAKTKMDILDIAKPNGKKVAIIGSGPSGLTASLELKKLGYDVVIFEQNSKPGGYMRYGIPSYRLPKDVLDTEIKRITKTGVIIKTNEIIDENKLNELKSQYDAVIVSIGHSKGKMLPLFEGNKKTMLAVDFLKKVSTKGNIKLPDNVVVIGGGDVAMDTCVTLKKLGVRNVCDVVYEELSEFKASKAEYDIAVNEHISIYDGYVPQSLKRGGIITFKHRFIESEIKIKVDLIILATGQTVDNNLGIEFEGNEAIVNNYRIKNSNVFVSGDIAKGDKTVVYAVRTGKEVAIAVNDYIGGGR